MSSSAATRQPPANQRISGWFAWSLLGLTCLLIVISFFPAWRYVAQTGDARSFLSHQLLAPLSAFVYALLGAFVAARRPRNPIGWIFLVVGLLYSLTSLITAYGLYATLVWGPAAFPGAGLAGWLSSWVWLPAIILPTTYVFLLFPDGHLPSPRWRVISLAVALGLMTAILGVTISPSPPETWGIGEPSPFAIAQAGPASDLMLNLASLLLALGLAGSVAALVVRFRRSQGRERDQMKWLIYSAALMIAGMVVGGLITYLWPDEGWALEASILLTNGAVLAIAIAATLAILRHRLYDINLIINRTIVYGALTAIVLALYFLVLGSAGLLLQTNRQALGLLLTTGLIVLLYRPLRNWLQWRVDRLVGVPGNYASVPASSSVSSLAAPTVSQSEQEAGLPSPKIWMKLARLIWIPTALLSLAILIASVPLMIADPPLGVFEGRLVLEQTSFSSFLMGTLIIVIALAAAVSLALAALLYFKKPGDRMSLYLAYYLLANGILMAGPIEALHPLWPAAPAFNSFVLLPLFAGPMTMALAGLFPDGRFVPSWSRGLVLISLIVLPVGWWFGQGLISFNATPRSIFVVGTTVLLATGTVTAAAYAQIYRYRHVSNKTQRQQTKWVLYGMGIWLIVQVVSSAPWLVALGLPPGSTLPWWSPIVTLLYIGSTLILPVTLTVAVLRYRLFEIDLIINRTLVFGGLTLVVFLLYGLVVGAMGALFQTQGNWIIALVATGLVAVLFQPLRHKLQRGVNRLIYGQRDEPFEVLANLGQQLEGSMAPESVLPTLVKTVAHTLKLPYVAIAVRMEDGFETVESYGLPVAEPLPYPLIDQGRLIGQLLVSPRTPGEDFSEADERLLRNIARQASTAVHTVQLTADLQRSRQRLVTTREEERRRLRRDLHDGLGPALAALNLQAAVLRRTIDDDPQTAQRMVDEFRGDIRDAIADIRRVVYELRPPALDQLGLVAAIRAEVDRYRRGSRQSDEHVEEAPADLAISLDMPEQVPDLPAAVEVAAYRIVQEALANVAHHAQARNCSLRLRVDTELRIEIIDDGRGLGDYAPGVGLISMRERAEELGGTFAAQTIPSGGTRIRATIPIT